MNNKQRIIRTAFLSLMLIAALISCDSPFGNDKLRASLAVAIDGAAANQRTILPAALIPADLTYDISLVRSGFATVSATGLAWNAIAANDLTPGEWSLTITGRLAGDAVFAKTQSVTLVSGANSVSISLDPVQTVGNGTGSLLFEVNLPAGDLVDAATVYWSNDPAYPEQTIVTTGTAGGITSVVTTDFVSVPGVSVSMSDVPSGNYYLTVALSKGGGDPTYVIEVVRIYDNRLSEKTKTLLAGDIGTAPAAPSGLAAAFVGNGSGTVTISWTDNSNVEQGYRVWRDGTLVGSDLTVPGTISLEDTLGDSLAHVYEVAAFNGFGESPRVSLDWQGSGTSSIGFSLSNPAFQAITFSNSDLQLNAGAALSLSTLNAALLASGSAWRWYLDDVLDAGQTGSNYAWALGNTVAPGNHIINLRVNYDGIEYSGSLRVTVLDMAMARYTVTYSSLGADSGNVPIDDNLYSTGEPATVVGNIGTPMLAKKGFTDIIGWTENSDGSGVLFSPGSTYTIASANVVLYPKWEGYSSTIGQMVHVPAGLEPSTGMPVAAFLMGATEVTQAQFQAVMGFNYSESGQWGVSIPVGNVTWYDALAFCNALSTQEGFDPVYTLSAITYYTTCTSSIQSATVTADFTKNGYRLPLLSERIWAARGGSSTDYAWGTTTAEISFYEWYDAISSGNFQPVATKLPNGYGLSDMGGNVYEWSWGSDYQATADPRRCGSTARNPDVNATSTAAASTISGAGGDLLYYDNGFRVARGVPYTSSLSTGLVGEWLCDGGGLADSSGYGGTIAANSAAAPASIPNHLADANSALYFNPSAGSTGYLISEPAALFRPNQAFSVSLWAKPTSATAAAGTVQYLATMIGTASNQFQYWIMINEGGLLVQLALNGNPIPIAVVSKTPVQFFTAGVWTHIVLVYTPGTMQVYIDGAPYLAPVTSIDTSLATVPMGTDNWIGGGYNPSYDDNLYYNGGLDNIRMYSRALSAAEVMGLYNE
ncbi:MAG TPA: hypothetical protein DIC34_13330 [Treponema sp.]|nr:MAG: hypothetical protein A2001_07330 [Treponema sp. GWC1_61_84]HCM27505.1 hypothetical protein [Treponema sp.]